MSTHVVHERHDPTEVLTFGFWVYIMSDCLLFASLFATYAVLHDNTFGGPSSHGLFSLPFVLAETLILLTSSFTCGLTIVAMHRERKYEVLIWLVLTAILGILFILLELHEFADLAANGNSWSRSGFLSGFFTLVATHGLHVTGGLIWMLLMMVQIWIRGLTEISVRRLFCLSLFWHFLDIVWIFIFTFVYLLGVL